MAALSKMYAQGRFLGGYIWSGPHGDYVDSSSGDTSSFKGKEVIRVDDVIAYRLRYFGGLIKA
jgi:hypothetical protein